MAVISLVFICGVLAGCNNTSSQEIKAFQGFTMGTTYSIKYVHIEYVHIKYVHIKYFHRKSLKKTDVIKKAVDKKLKKVNGLMSTWDPESDLSKINKAPADKWLSLHPDLSKLIAFAFDLSRKTNGKYDVAGGPLINLWGFGPNGGKKVPSDKDIEKAMHISGYGKIDLKDKENRLKKKDRETYIDLSSIAKGYGVDQVALTLEKFNIKNYMVEIGGEIRTKGKKGKLPWRIAIESPRKEKIKHLIRC